MSGQLSDGSVEVSLNVRVSDQNCNLSFRSATCALAYAMIRNNMTAVDALTQFRQHRDVRPNDGFMEQLVALDNDLRAHREIGQDKKIVLSGKNTAYGMMAMTSWYDCCSKMTSIITRDVKSKYTVVLRALLILDSLGLNDHKLLPQAWNFEFWTKPVTEEEIGLPLVKLGEPCPITVTQTHSMISSRRSSRVLSRRSSKKSVASRISSKSRISSRSVSRHSSFRTADVEGGEDWEWVWEDEEEEEEDINENHENVDPQPQIPNPLTEERLLEVKDILEKPEEKWRILWQSIRNCDSPSSVSSSIRFVKNSISFMQ